jgi:protein TonB
MRWSWWVSLAVHGALLAGFAAAAGGGLVGPAAEPPVCIATAMTAEPNLLPPSSNRELFALEIPDLCPPLPEAVRPDEAEPAPSECSFASLAPAELRLAQPELPGTVVIVVGPAEPPAAPAAAPRAPASAADEFAAAEARPRAGNPRPGYPERALRLGLEGRVLVRLFVSAEGEVVRAVVAETSGSRLLDGAALGALRRWRFAPATLRGAPVAAAVLVPVEFRIGAGSSS